MNRINLNVPINPLGYGVVGFNLWKNLSTITDTTLWPIGGLGNISTPIKPDEETVSRINQDLSKEDMFDVAAPCLKVWHENQLAERIGRGRYFVLPFFEVNKFNLRRKTHLAGADEIIVTSEWAKSIILDQVAFLNKENAEKFIHVVPCGVDREIFNEQQSEDNLEKCIFFNCGKWETRKGHDILHQAFKDAFPGNEDVELWMMADNPFLQPQEKQQWLDLYSHPKIKILPRVQYQQELASVMNKTYCGVFPAKAEGWNLELLEMMSCGKHVITTNYSAHTQFCNEHNSLLIDIESEEPAYDGKWFVGDNGTWASLRGSAYDQLVQHLKDIYHKWENQPKEKNLAGIDTALGLSWEKMAVSINNIIFGKKQ